MYYQQVLSCFMFLAQFIPILRQIEMQGKATLGAVTDHRNGTPSLWGTDRISMRFLGV